MKFSEVKLIKNTLLFNQLGRSPKVQDYFLLSTLKNITIKFISKSPCNNETDSNHIYISYHKIIAAKAYKKNISTENH